MTYTAVLNCLARFVKDSKSIWKCLLMVRVGELWVFWDTLDDLLREARSQPWIHQSDWDKSADDLERKYSDYRTTTYKTADGDRTETIYADD